jgi:hypothetical protein
MLQSITYISSGRRNLRSKDAGLLGLGRQLAWRELEKFDDVTQVSRIHRIRSLVIGWMLLVGIDCSFDDNCLRNRI